MSANLIIITGPSGFGKGQLLNKVISLFPDKYIKVISYTDKPESNKTNNEYFDFHFIDQRKFSSMIDAGCFLEWQRVPLNGYRYGKTKKDIQETITAHSDKIIFLEVNVINLPILKRHYPKCKSIFIDVKDNNFLMNKLKSLTDIESEEEYERRYKFANEERKRRHLADYIINMRENEEETLHMFFDVIEKCCVFF